jgi:hypothetical protein
MNWEALGAIGETLGALAVFVTLGYLAVQVRHARSDSRRALSQNRGEGIRDLFAQGTDERINRLSVKANTALGAPPPPFVAALMDQAGLTREEATVLFQHHVAWWNYTLQIVPNIDEMSAIEQHQFDRGVTGRHGGVGIGRLFYESVAPLAHPDVVRYIENVLARAT